MHCRRVYMVYQVWGRPVQPVSGIGCHAERFGPMGPSTYRYDGLAAVYTGAILA